LPALLHVSDVHFGPKHLPAAAAAVARLVAEARPDAVVVSGDLTQRAKPSQFRAARAWIDALGAPVVFTPGNHDVPLWRVWERLFAPFGAWRRWFAPELDRDHFGAGLAIVAVNTAHAWTTKHGRVRAGDIAAARERLERAPPGAARILVAHHPLADCGALDDEPVARRGRRLLEAAAGAGAELVLSGHLHRCFAIATDRGPGLAGPLVVHCGTTTSSRGRGEETGRNSLHWIEIDERRIRVERRLFDPALERFETAATLERERPPRQPDAPGRDIIRRS
jgi:3',5'-cyclic AMP phosphodiesterase CpdA